MVVRVREFMRWQRTQPVMDDWTRRTLEAIQVDRSTEDYANDPDA